ncbi:TPA: hypothetical protein N0F65_009294 [Lagenidium giganteum]|uniref:Uncharacterized protein n=1 Tax=Lagenidium giganteum TaxID=4803 RepID=A0AAV2YRP9_9STRA|nr:TPA: hypothetical protein N0F65_009294 [Lagenidium giganteum]
MSVRAKTMHQKSAHESSQTFRHSMSLKSDTDEPATSERSAKLRAGSTRSDDTDDNNRLTMEEVEEKLKELQKPPSKEEIDALMAQYSDDYSDGSACSDSEDDKEAVIMKVLVVGNARCGKTSTIRRFVTKDFTDEYVSTIGADFVEKEIEHDNQLRVHLQLWDIAGQDRFAKLTRAYFREAKGAVIVCDITRENTIDAVMNWKNEIDACCKDLNHGESIPVVLIANKSDLLSNPMGALDIGVNMQKCVDHNGIIEWFRASAKNGDHIDDAFQCLLDRMVQDHRAHAAARASNSLDYESDTDSNSSHARRRDDIIRLSSLPPSRHDATKDSACGCN